MVLTRSTPSWRSLALLTSATGLSDSGTNPSIEGASPFHASSRAGDRGGVRRAARLRLLSVVGRCGSTRLSPRGNACYCGADLRALPGRRDGRGPGRRTEQHRTDGFQHLAKMRVAGSNPVVRSRRNGARSEVWLDPPPWVNTNISEWETLAARIVSVSSVSAARAHD